MQSPRTPVGPRARSLVQLPGWFRQTVPSRRGLGKSGYEEASSRGEKERGKEKKKGEEKGEKGREKKRAAIGNEAEDERGAK